MRGLKFRGRPPIHIADSIKSVVDLSNPYAAAINNRSKTIDEDFVRAIIGQSSFLWEKRNPSPALDEDGNFIGTDFDALTALTAFVARNAVLAIPDYKTHRERVIDPNVRHLSYDRFGKTTALTSNQKFFTFSVRIFDQSIATFNPATGEEVIGADRNFMIVDPTGKEWHRGWRTIEFKPTAAENDFLTKKDLWTDNSIVFKHAVHPNRWQSPFGAPYLLCKYAYNRLGDQAKYYSELRDAMLAAGLEYPAGKGPKSSSGGRGYSSRSMKRTVPGLEFDLDMPVLVGEYPKLPTDEKGNYTQESLVMAYELAKLASYTLRPMLQAVIRADELAYYLHGADELKVASWLSKRSFKDYKPPSGKGSKSDWKQLVLSSDASLRFRRTAYTDKALEGFSD